MILNQGNFFIRLQVRSVDGFQLVWDVSHRGLVYPIVVVLVTEVFHCRSCGQHRDQRGIDLQGVLRCTSLLLLRKEHMLLHFEALIHIPLFCNSGSLSQSKMRSSAKPSCGSKDLARPSGKMRRMHEHIHDYS